jgi:hypothetical protein
MTYSVSIQGHGDEPYEERAAAERRLLGALVGALDEHGGNVTTFSFSGNEVNASSLDEARSAAEAANDDSG